MMVMVTIKGRLQPKRKPQPKPPKIDPSISRMAELLGYRVCHICGGIRSNDDSEPCHGHVLAKGE